MTQFIYPILYFVQIASVVEKIEDMKDIGRELSEEKSSGSQAGSSSLSRRKIGTGYENCSERTRRRRSAETYKAAEKIHAGREGDVKSCTIGLLNTIESKCDEDDLVDAMNDGRCKKLRKVFPRVYKKALRSYESTTEDMLRSIAVYYSNGVMGKVKYRSVYKASTYSYSVHEKKAVRMTVANCPIPHLVPYHRLVAYTRSIDVGKLHSVRDTLCDGLDDKNKVSGCYRDLEELLVRLAEFYLSTGLYQILTFTETNTFHIALGGDGAPFGKDDSACAWLVSVLNIGQGVLSSNENFLLFGGNCSENCVPIKRFLQKLLIDIRRIEATTYTVSCKGDTVNVKFLISELPNDMKMLSFLGGELSNSAKYFSSFGDVTLETAKKPNNSTSMLIFVFVFVMQFLFLVALTSLMKR